MLQVQLRGEYAYVAAGEGGLRVYDVAQIDRRVSRKESSQPLCHALDRSSGSRRGLRQQLLRPRRWR